MISWKKEWKNLSLIAGLFILFYFVPFEKIQIQTALLEGFYLVSWYAREHVILCLVPAFFIAGAIAVFINQNSVIKYLGADSNKFVAYGVASVSGSILAVCSCTVLPLFAGIYRMGAGIGPASAFLYSGPAINIMAMILTARVLGFELGIARAVGAVLFSIVIGLMMHLIFHKEDAKINSQLVQESDIDIRPLWQTAFYFGVMILILVLATFGKPEELNGFWYSLFQLKWILTGIVGIIYGFILSRWFNLPKGPLILVGLITALLSFIFSHQPLIPFSTAFIGLSIIISRRSDESGDWFAETYGFAKQILPLLLGGVFIAGIILGRPGGDGLIPAEWVASNVGGNSIGANLFASVVGAFMYFATLTEIPILQGLIGNGMGKGPALALLLAGPALSLPNMFVINTIFGLKKTFVFVMLVIVTATITGLLYGYL